MKKPDKAGARSLGGPKRSEWDNSEAVDEFMAKLDRPLREKMEAVKSVIMSADPRITEGIKWNAPSCYCHEWFATFSRSPRAKDPSGILEWITNDRCIAKFDDMSDIDAKKAALRTVAAQWVSKLSDEAKSD